MQENGRGSARDSDPASEREFAQDLSTIYRNNPAGFCDALHKQNSIVQRIVVSRGSGNTNLRMYLGLEMPSRYGRTPHAHHNWPAPLPHHLALAAAAVDSRDEALRMLARLGSTLAKESARTLQAKPEYRDSVKEALLHLLGHLHLSRWSDTGQDRDRIMNLVLDNVDKLDGPAQTDISNAIQSALSANDDAREKPKPYPALTPAKRYANSIRQEWRAKSDAGTSPTPLSKPPAAGKVRRTASAPTVVIEPDDVSAQEDADLQRAMEESRKSAPPPRHMQHFLDRHTVESGPLRVLRNEGDRNTGSDVCLALLQMVTCEPDTDKLLQKATELQARYFPQQGDASGSALFSVRHDNPRFRKLVEIINKEYGVELDVRVISADASGQFRISQAARGKHPVVLVDDGERHLGLFATAPAPNETGKSPVVKLSLRSNAAVRVVRELHSQARRPATVRTPSAAASPTAPALPVVPAKRTAKPKRQVVRKTRAQLLAKHRGILKATIKRLAETPDSDPHATLKRNKAKALDKALQLMTIRTWTEIGYKNSTLEIVQSGGTRPLSDRFSPSVPTVPFEATSDFIRFDKLDEGEVVLVAGDSKFGGGVLGRGMAQEEMAFMSCPELLLGVAQERHDGEPTLARKDEYTNTNPDNFRPVMVKGAIPLTAMRDSTAKLTADNPEHARRPDNIFTNSTDYDPAKAMPAVVHPKPIDMLCVAAPKLRDEERGKPYSSDTILDMTGNFAEALKMLDIEKMRKRGKPLHSLLWGTGIFKHSPVMSIAVQKMVCDFYGVPLKIHGAGNQAEVSKAKSLVARTFSRAQAAVEQGHPVELGDMARILQELAEQDDIRTKPLKQHRTVSRQPALPQSSIGRPISA
jgi:hypothetical protein